MGKLADAYLAIIPKLDSAAMNSAVSGITGKLGSVAKVGAKAFAAVSAAATAAGVAITKSALDGYAAYEQNVGGMQKLYSESAQTMISQAQNAYKTCGMSANQYMEQASSFSAALVNSLAGDTKAAAAQAQKAMVAMSDNVNTFGTDMQDVTNAFQGFAKQNYTMLDNLKLGYGGTQSEMKRLIADANEYAASIGQAADLSIDSFSDIVTAIDLIQQKQNIAGTTAKEAATTIEGSINSMKAAWENWLTSLGDDDWDVSVTTENLVNAFETAAQNVVPRITKIIGTLISEIPGLLSDLSPTLASSLQTMFTQAFESVFKALPPQVQVGIAEVLLALDESGLGSTLKGMFDGASEGAQNFIDGLGQVANIFSTGLTPTFSLVNTALELLQTFFFAIADTAETNLLPALEWLSTAWSDLCDNLQEAQPWLDVLSAGLGETLVIAVTGAIEILAVLVEGISQIIEFFNSLIETVSDSVDGFADFVDGVGKTLGTLPDAMAGWLSGMMSDIASFASGLGESARTAGQNFVTGLQTKFNDAVSFVGGIPERITGALGNVGSLLYNAGKSIINGFLNGLKSAWNNVTSFVSGIAGWISSHKGPISYDKKLLVPNGRAITDSLLTGLKASYGDVQSFVSGIADDIAGGMGTVEVAASASTPNAALVGAAKSGAVTNRTSGTGYASSDLSRVVSLLEAIRDKDSDVYMDSTKVSAALTQRSRYAMAGRGIA